MDNFDKLLDMYEKLSAEFLRTFEENKKLKECIEMQLTDIRRTDVDMKELLEEKKKLRLALQNVYHEVDIDAMDDNEELQRQLSTMARIAKNALGETYD